MNVNPEIKQEEKKLPEQKEIIQQDKVQVGQPEVETEKDINWKKFKEARAQERKQAEEMAKKASEKEAEAAALKSALEAIVNRPNQQQQNYSNQEYQEEETEDQRIEKKVNELLSKREQERLIKNQQEEQKQLPQRLKQTYSDFDQVCSASNLDYLEYHHPELAQSLGSQPDSIDKWNKIYNSVKRYVPNLDMRKEQAKAEANFKKPQSLSTPGTTQGGNAMPSSRLDDSKKAENWARMQKALKGIS